MRIGGKDRGIPRDYNLSEYIESFEIEIKEFLANLEYWRYTFSLNKISYRSMNFDVDLDLITDDASLCDWIMYVHNRQWIEESAILEFLDFVLVYRINNYKSEAIKKYF